MKYKKDMYGEENDECYKSFIKSLRKDWQCSDALVNDCIYLLYRTNIHIGKEGVLKRRAIRALIRLLELRIGEPCNWTKGLQIKLTDKK